MMGLSCPEKKISTGMIFWEIEMGKCNCSAEPFEPCDCFVAFPKPGKPKKQGKTKAEDEHLEWIASLPCSIKGCQRPSNVHHIRKHGDTKDHFKSIPLCHHHHQGKEGIHDKHGKKSWSEKYGDELEHLEELKARYPERFERDPCRSLSGKAPF